MNIQVNLLPEAKLSKIRNKSKRKFYGSITIALASVGVVTAVTFILLYGFLLGTYRVGEQNLKSLNEEVDKKKTLEERATTLQNNLASFTLLNENRTYSSRIFYNLFKILPANISINSVQISKDNVITLSASTDNFKDVAKFENTLEIYNVDYLPQEGLDRKPIFYDADITSISKAEDGKVDFTIAVKVDQSMLKKQVEK